MLLIIKNKVNTQQYLKNGFLRCNSKIFSITYKQPLTYLENKYAIKEMNIPII